jgi:hypothetical protein
VREALTGAILIAAVSTLGDFIWATWIPRHRPIYGMSHGILLFMCIGLFLGVIAKRAMFGAVAGAAIGGLAAGSFYVLAPVAGYSIMFFVWFGMWIGLSIFNRHLSGSRNPVVRGLIAAVASAVAFYLVSGIWFPFRPRGWDYAVHFAAWTVAYFPGFAALLVRR